MATREGAANHLGRDDRFFLKMAIAMALTIVAGFSLQLAMGRSTFAAPAALHVHAVIFFGWTLLYVAQNYFVARGVMRVHRPLGWIAAGWAAAMVIVGIHTTVAMVQRGSAPFFFQPAFFLIMNSLSVLGFAGLTAAGIALRRRTEWHRRLLLCGTALLTGPAFGRLLPMPLMIPSSDWAVFAAILIFPVIGVMADRRRRGSVHPAWGWGIGVIAALQLATHAIAFSAPGLALYSAVTKGHPGEAVAPFDFPPPPASPILSATL